MSDAILNPELSRRVAKVMQTSMIIAMEPEQRLEFVEAVESAKTFNDLPPKYKALVLMAEAELDVSQQPKHKSWQVSAKGSSRSGNYGHAGRPGKVGGSSPKAGVVLTDAIKDEFKDPTLRDKLDAYLSQHDIVPEDLMIDGKPIVFTDKMPSGIGETRKSWEAGGNAHVSNYVGNPNPKLHIPAKTVENNPEVILHEIGHLVYDPYRENPKWRNGVMKDVSQLAAVKNNDELAKIGTRVYMVMEVGKREGFTPSSEAFADMFMAWKLGDSSTQNNISALLAKHGLDADSMFGSKRHAKELTIQFRYKGSARSGNYGHRGRPGKVGGSSPKGGAVIGFTDSRFYQGDITGKSADELFDGSSKEVQDLAVETGILATDAATLAYILDHKSQFVNDKPYPPIYENRISMPAGIEFLDEDIAEKRWFNVYKPISVSYRPGIGGIDASQLTDGEKDVLAKLVKANADVDGGLFGGNIGKRLSQDEMNVALGKSWNSMSAQEQAIARDLLHRYKVAEWANLNLPATLPGKSMTNFDKADGWLNIGKVPSGLETARDIKRFGWDYRGKFVKKQVPAPEGLVEHSRTQVLALSSLPKDRAQAVRDQFTSSWDKEHHTFDGVINDAFQIHPQRSVMDGFAAAKTNTDNVQANLYHGTDYRAAKSIGATGFRVSKADVKSGRAMGSGVYLADVSSKSSQYLSESGFGVKSSGVVFMVDAAKGKQVDFKSPEFKAGNWDSAFGGVDYWKNPEWCIGDSKAVLPTIWLDVSVSGLYK